MNDAACEICVKDPTMISEELKSLRMNISRWECKVETFNCVNISLMRLTTCKQEEESVKFSC